MCTGTGELLLFLKSPRHSLMVWNSASLAVLSVLEAPLLGKVELGGCVRGRAGGELMVGSA